MFVSKRSICVWSIATLLVLSAVWMAAQSTTPNKAKGPNLYDEDLGSSPALLPRSYEPVNGVGGEDVSGPYEVVADWPRPLHKDFRMGGGAGVIAESPDRIFVLVRGEEPARPKPYVWGADLFTIPGQMKKANGANKGSRWEHIVNVFDRQGNLVES
jgi:hypothetical protein